VRVVRLRAPAPGDRRVAGSPAVQATQTYYACQLFYVGCTANADVAAELFGADDALTTYATPSRFGSRAEMTTGFPPCGGATRRRADHACRAARPRPSKGRQGLKHQIAAFCEVGTMLTDRLGVH